MARNNQVPNSINYIRNLFAQEDGLLTKIKNSTPPDKQAIQVGAEEGKLIYLLLKLIRAKSALEIGTCVGYSTLWIARSLEEGGKLVSIEKSSEHYNIAKENLKELIEKNKIQLINDDANTIEEYVNGMIFDVVFIDANKQGYPHYLEIAYKLLRKGGLIIADNVFLFGSVYEENVGVPQKLKLAMQEFNRKISDSSRFESVIIPTQEGMSISIKI